MRKANVSQRALPLELTPPGILAKRREGIALEPHEINN